MHHAMHGTHPNTSLEMHDRGYASSRLHQASVLVSAGYGCVVFLLLAAKQFVAKRADASRLLELTAMIKVMGVGAEQSRDSRSSTPSTPSALSFDS